MEPLHPLSNHLNSSSANRNWRSTLSRLWINLQRHSPKFRNNCREERWRGGDRGRDTASPGPALTPPGSKLSWWGSGNTGGAWWGRGQGRGWEQRAGAGSGPASLCSVCSDGLQSSREVLLWLSSQPELLTPQSWELSATLMLFLISTLSPAMPLSAVRARGSSSISWQTLIWEPSIDFTI